MSVQITLKNGMGITQGIAKELNLSNDDLKLLNKNGGSTIWSTVLKKAQAGQFTGEGTLAGSGKVVGRDAGNLSKKEWAFKAGDTVSINQTKFEEIRQLINNKLAELKGTSHQTSTTPSTPQQTIKEEADRVELKTLSSDTTTVQPLKEFTTGKQLTRYVDGQKQSIEIAENADGQKTRYLVNKDGTRGEELVTVTTTGKNTYKTKSKFEAEVKNVLGLGEIDEIPSDLKPFYIEISGEPQLMFKSAQGTLTPKQALDLIEKQKQTQEATLDPAVQKTKWEQSKVGKLVLDTTSKLDLSGLNLNGTTPTDTKDPLYAGDYNNQLMQQAGVSQDDIKGALTSFKDSTDINTITSGTQKRSTIKIGGKDFTVIQTQGNIGVFSPNNLTQPIYLATYTPKNIQNSDSQFDQTRLGRGYGLNPAPSTTTSTPTTPPPAPHSGSGETNPYMKTGSFSQGNTSETGGQYWTKKSPYEE